MDVSRITLSPEVKHQMSTKARLLKWMQENPKQLKSTSIAQLARTAASHLDHIEKYTAQKHLQQMVNSQMLLRKGGIRRSDFTINYMHKDIPSDILDEAPASVQEMVKRTIQGMKPEQYLDDVGCVTTPKPEEPTIETTEETPSSEQDTPVEQEIKAPLTVTKDGMTININLTIKL